MPLTAAEKMRRYREKLKTERPEEYEAQRKRHLAKIKSNKKKISEMTDVEKKIQREKWRVEKRKKREEVKAQKIAEEKKNKKTISVISQDQIIKRLRKRSSYLLSRCRFYESQSATLKTQLQKYKKRLARLKQSSQLKISQLNNNLLKSKAREEILESTLKKSYKTLKTRRDKNILKLLIKNSRNKTYLTSMLGLSQKPRNRKKTNRIIHIAEIKSFFMRDDVSRNTSGRKETRTKNKIKQQIRYLLDTLVNTYKKYKAEGGVYGFTTFYKNKPYFVLSPGLTSRDTCLCIKHANLEMKHIALKKYGLVEGNIKDILNRIVCDTKKYECMYNQCQQCKDQELQLQIVDNNLPEKITWNQWEQENHEYTKREGDCNKTIKTKRTVKSLKEGSIKELLENFNKDILIFKKHHFNMAHQQTQYQKLVTELKENEAVIICDFSENYGGKMSSEIQAMHFGASKSQITIHTGMVYWRDTSQSFCTLSDANNHQPPAIWAHLTPILDLIKEKSPNVSVVHFYSDGPSSQYRQKNNFYLLWRYTNTYGFDYCTWSYFESGHGKSVADGIGGCVKRMLDTKVCYGKDIRNATEAYNALKESNTCIKVFYIPEHKITEVFSLLPNKVPVLKGTMLIHQITTTNNNMLKYKNISCFCGIVRGDCLCFCPQYHCIAPDVENFANQPSISENVIRSHSCENRETEDLCKQLLPKKPIREPLTEILNNSTSFSLYDPEDLEFIQDLVKEDPVDQNIDLIDIDVLPIVIEIQDTDSLPSNPLTEVKEPCNISSPKKKSKILKVKDSVYCVPGTSKALLCNQCNVKIISSRKAKCMACQKSVCEKCVNGDIHFDFVCVSCLLGSDSD